MRNCARNRVTVDCRFEIEQSLIRDRRPAKIRRVRYEKYTVLLKDSAFAGSCGQVQQLLRSTYLIVVVPTASAAAAASSESNGKRIISLRNVGAFALPIPRRRAVERDVLSANDAFAAISCTAATIYFELSAIKASPEMNQLARSTIS